VTHADLWVRSVAQLRIRRSLASTSDINDVARGVRYHYRGNTAGSTLRLTLGCLLGLELRRVGSGKRMTFGKAGEATLRADHAS
jgi:hypothetical protein